MRLGRPRPKQTRNRAAQRAGAEMDPGYRQSGNWLVGGEPWLREPAHPGADTLPLSLLPLQDVFDTRDHFRRMIDRGAIVSDIYKDGHWVFKQVPLLPATAIHSNRKPNPSCDNSHECYDKSCHSGPQLGDGRSGRGRCWLARAFRMDAHAADGRTGRERPSPGCLRRTHSTTFPV